MREKKGWGLLAASAAAMAAAGVGAASAAGFHQAVLRRDRSREQWEAYIESGKWEEHSGEILAGIRYLLGRVRHLVVVTNEIFSDGIDYDPETMRYQSYLGQINSEMGRMADRVTEVVYGIPITVKGERA